MACSPTACCSCWRWGWPAHVGSDVASLVSALVLHPCCGDGQLLPHVLAYSILVPSLAFFRCRCPSHTPALPAGPLAGRSSQPPFPQTDCAPMQRRCPPTACLQVSFPYIGIADLRAIPLAVLDQLQVGWSVARHRVERSDQRFKRGEQQAGGTQKDAPDMPHPLPFLHASCLCRSLSLRAPCPARSLARCSRCLPPS